jgi:hypothetical protein
LETTTANSFCLFWLIDCLLTDVRWAIFQLDENMFNNVKKLYRNEGSDGSTRSTTFDCHWKSMESWVGTNNLVLCSDYNMPTLFRNLQKRFLACHSPNMSSTMVHSQAFRIISSTTLIKRPLPICNLFCQIKGHNSRTKKVVMSRIELGLFIYGSQPCK